MKKPSGMPNSALVAAAQRIAHGSFGVGSGTGTSTPPGATQSRQCSAVMKVGSGGRAAVGSGVGKIGRSAAMTPAGTRIRGSRGLARSARSRASASTVAISGISARANRIGNAPSTTGSAEQQRVRPRHAGPLAVDHQISGRATGPP